MSDESRAGGPGRLSNNTRKRLALAGLIGLAALAGFAFIRNPIDFPVYYAAGRSLLAGRTDLYSPDFARGPLMDYRYPPFFLIASSPLWFLPYRIAAYVWYLLGTLEIVACFAAVNAISRKGGAASRVQQAGYKPGTAKAQSTQSRTPFAVWAFTIAAVAQYVVMNLHYGNAQTITTFLVYGGLYLAISKSAKGREAWAALLIALAITIKVTPALLLPYFGIKRRWRLLVLTGACVITLNLAPSIYFGITNNARLLGEWYRHVVGDQEFHEINGPVNLSLKGQLHRSLTDIDYGERLDGDSNYPAVNLTRLPSDQINQLWIILASVLFAGTLIWMWWAGRAPNEGRYAEHTAVPVELRPRRRSFGEIGVMICLMLLVQPLTSKIYFIALIWPMWALLRLGYGGQQTKRGRVIALAASGLAMVNVVLPLLPGRSIQRLVLVLGADFYLTCLLLLLGLFALVSDESSAPSQAGGLQTKYQRAARTP